MARFLKGFNWHHIITIISVVSTMLTILGVSMKISSDISKFTTTTDLRLIALELRSLNNAESLEIIKPTIQKIETTLDIILGQTKPVKKKDKFIGLSLGFKNS